MATQRAAVEYNEQPYFNKAAQRPPKMSAANNNKAPSNINVTRMRQKEGKSLNPNYPSVDQTFNQSYAKAGLQPANLDARPDRTQKARTTYATAEPTHNQTAGPWGSATVSRRKKKKKSLTSKVTEAVLRKAKITAVNTWIGSWAMFWYLTFQVPLALISTAGLGIAYTVFSYLDDFTKTVVGKAIGYLFNGEYIKEMSSKLITAAFHFFGIEFDPMLLFIVPFALIFLLGLMQLILTWFIYTLLGIRSLSGRAAGLKGLMFVLAGVGYAVPILNLFPLIFLWMIVVWINPK